LNKPDEKKEDTKPFFGGLQIPKPEENKLLGTAITQPTETKPLFGIGSTTEKKETSLFPSFSKPETNTNQQEKKEEQKTLFGASTLQTEKKEEVKPMFGNLLTTQPKSDGLLSAKPEETKPSFGFFTKPAESEKKEEAPKFGFTSEDKKEEVKPTFTPPTTLFGKTEDKKDQSKSIFGGPQLNGGLFGKPEDKKEETKPTFGIFGNTLTKPEEKKEDIKSPLPSLIPVSGETKKDVIPIQTPETKPQGAQSCLTLSNNPFVSAATSSNKTIGVSPNLPKPEISKFNLSNPNPNPFIPTGSNINTDDMQISPVISPQLKPLDGPQIPSISFIKLDPSDFSLNKYPGIATVFGNNTLTQSNSFGKNSTPSSGIFSSGGVFGNVMNAPSGGIFGNASGNNAQSFGGASGSNMFGGATNNSTPIFGAPSGILGNAAGNGGTFGQVGNTMPQNGIQGIFNPPPFSNGQSQTTPPLNAKGDKKFSFGKATK
jgi:hypothetical protein